MSVSSGKTTTVKLIGNKDGTYSILTPTSDYNSALSVINTSEGKAIQQWEYTGAENQKFVLEPVQPEPEKMRGDLNADGTFGVADLVLLQKFLLGAEKELPDWQAGDLDEDGRLDMFDLVKMRQLIVFIMN